MTDEKFSHKALQTYELDAEQTKAEEWFRSLRDTICASFEALEDDLGQLDGDPPTGTAKNDLFLPKKDLPAGRFDYSSWQRINPEDQADGGGGTMAVMRGGRVFEKVGVNISSVYGTFSPEFAQKIPGASEDRRFFATGISLVAHLQSPLVPAVHMNTRYITTTKNWFGGGADLNAPLPVEKDTEDFHKAFADCCNRHDPAFYPRFKKWCDEYFYIPHRNRARGEGGIFYDQHNTGNWDADFAFTKDVGSTFNKIYPKLISRHMNKAWTAEQREIQLRYRGLYAEFNLVYDRGTTFGLKTGGNVDAILMSLPPEAKWY